MQVYVGCGLTHATDEFVASVLQFKEQLAKEAGCSVLEFLGLTAGTAADVYLQDLGNVEKSDVMIALVDEVSIGVGMEIQHAIAIKKPLLCLAKEGTRVTRMVLGAGELGHLTFSYYSDWQDATQKAVAFINAQA